jgi:hypothetical protein
MDVLCDRCFLDIERTVQDGMDVLCDRCFLDLERTVEEGMIVAFSRRNEGLRLEKTVQEGMDLDYDPGLPTLCAKLDYTHYFRSYSRKLLRESAYL